MDTRRCLSEIRHDFRKKDEASYCGLSSYETKKNAYFFTSMPMVLLFPFKISAFLGSLISSQVGLLSQI